LRRRCGGFDFGDDRRAPVRRHQHLRQQRVGVERHRRHQRVELVGRQRRRSGHLRGFLRARRTRLKRDRERRGRQSEHPCAHDPAPPAVRARCYCAAPPETANAFKEAIPTHGAINEAVRETPAWPLVVNLRADPYERAWEESGLYLRWYAENTMWTFVPVQGFIKSFFETFPDYPFQGGSSLTASNLGYQTLRNADLLQRLQNVENVQPANRQ
jgi:hypothetical protein